MSTHINRALYSGVLSISLVFLFAFAFITHFPSNGYAEEEDFSLEVITKVRVVGNNRIPTSSITYYLDLKENNTFDKRLLSKDIKNLYKLDHFENITAEVNKVRGGVEIVFNVREKPSVSSVRISGNKHIATADIAKRVTVKKGMVFKPSLMHKNAKRIKKYYQGEGYYFVDVKPSFKETVNGKVTVKFKVEEGPKALISSIKFVGNDNVDADDFLKYMRLQEEMIFLSWFTSRGVFKEKDFQQDLKAIEAVMQTKGYLKGKVTKYFIDAKKEKREINITIYVEEGSVYTFKDITVKGDDIFSSEELQESLEIKSGETYNREFVGNDIASLTNKYAEKGFAFTDVIPLMKEDNEAKTISVTYEINRGERAYIGSINIIGNESTRDFVIRRELRFQENQILDTVSLKRSKQRLNDLGFFESVKMNYLKNKEGLMDMKVEVIERPTNTFSAGVGYSQEESMIFTTSVNMKNFLGNGQNLNATIDASAIRRNFSLGFVEPWFMNRELSLGGSIYNNSLDYTSFKTDTFGVGLSLGKALDEESYLSFGYDIRNVKTSDVDNTVASNFLFNGSSISNSFSTTYVKDARDSKRRPTEGYKLTSSALVAGLIGDKYYKLNASGGYYQPFGKKIVGFLRATIGYGNSYAGDVFKSYARYTGNTSLLRGYKITELGPKDLTGDILGGNAELYFGVEVSYALHEMFKPYIFYDRGNLYGDGGDLSTTAKSFSLSQMRESVGLGVLVETPIGPLNFSYGFKIAPAPGDTASQFNFGIGGSF